MNTVLLPAATAAPPPELILKALERVLASGEFAGSAQLCRFLRYVVENAMEGSAGLLKESVIGVAVFNRGAAYDPKADPIVRVEARRLRARLAAYYEGAGAADPVRISLPKGGYVPAFETMTPLAAEIPMAEKPERRFRLRWLALAAGVSLAATAVFAYVYTGSGPERVVGAFWSSILEADRPALLIPADSALVMLQNLARQPVSLQEYVTGEYRARVAAKSAFAPQVVFDLSGRRYTSIADLEFASRLSHRAEAVRRGVATRFARDVRVEDLKGTNVILLGARQSNPWVELFERDATFRLDDDPATGNLRVVNLTPQNGEPAVIAPDMQKEIYGIITYHPNRDGSGAALVVAGMTVAGTESAADFLLDDSRMLPWLKKARARGGFSGFDILLRGRNLAGAAARADVMAFHLQK